jgi:Tfp pilus assembly protein PilO
MGGVLKNLHWILILIASIKLGWAYYEFSDESSKRGLLLENVKEDYKKEEKTKKDVKKYLSNIEEEKARIERVAQEIEKTQQLLPSELSDSENIGQVRKIAEDVNIKEVSIAPEAEELRGFYIARKYRFKAKATYLQFLIMFEKIYESRRILNIGEVNFRKLEQPQRSKFQVIEGDFVLEAYKYNQNFKEDRGLDKLEQRFKADNGPKEKKPRKSKKAAADGGGD